MKICHDCREQVGDLFIGYFAGGLHTEALCYTCIKNKDGAEMITQTVRL